MWKATYKSTSTATEPSGKNHMQNIKKKRGSFLGILARKFTEVSYSVLPITVLVIITFYVDSYRN